MDDMKPGAAARRLDDEMSGSGVFPTSLVQRTTGDAE
jgi:hypothetical protein